MAETAPVTPLVLLAASDSLTRTLRIRRRRQFKAVHPDVIAAGSRIKQLASVQTKIDFLRNFYLNSHIYTERPISRFNYTHMLGAKHVH